MPLRIELPGGRGAATEVTVPLRAAPRAAAILTVLVPSAMVVAGLVISVAGAVVAETAGGEAPGSLAVEAGAAIWFGGALTLGARRGATARRGLLLLLLVLAGAVLIAVALALGWTGAALTLAMEFGVGAVAVAVLDVVLLGVLFGRLERLAATQPGSALVVRVGGSWHVVDVRVVPSTAGS